MPEQEKIKQVIKGLKYLHDVKRWSPDESEESITARRNITGDALALLKAQEPVEPTTKNGAYFCGNPHCRKIIAQMVPCGAPTHRVKYCSECGKAVKWE